MVAVTLFSSASLALTKFKREIHKHSIYRYECLKSVCAGLGAETIVSCINEPPLPHSTLGDAGNEHWDGCRVDILIRFDFYPVYTCLVLLRNYIYIPKDCKL